MAVELPRHVKKPGGLWKRVETQAELKAALQDGWALRLDQQPAAVSDASDPEPPPVRVVVGGPDLHNPQAEPVAQQPAEVPEPEPEPEPESDDPVDADNEPAEEPVPEDSDVEPARRKPGRPPRHDSAKKK